LLPPVGTSSGTNVARWLGEWCVGLWRTLIGHSFGGLIAEKLVGMDRPAAAIAIDADCGHSLTIDSGWREVAEACLG
jgi:alpha/beta superfamily hydrolase